MYVACTTPKPLNTTPLTNLHLIPPPQIGAVTHLDFCQHYPFDLAVTSSTRVLVYDSRTSELKRTFARFKDKAYSGCFRPGDGKLLVAGSEDGVVQASACT